MNNDPMIYAAAALLVLVFGTGIGLAIQGHRRRRHTELTITDFAEVAECNGVELTRMHNELIAAAALVENPMEAARLHRWADTAHRIAGEHRQCINAISITALQNVGSEHLAAMRKFPLLGKGVHHG